MKIFSVGDRVRLRFAGHLGTITVVLVPGYRVLVQWDNGLFGPAQIHELEKVSA